MMGWDQSKNDEERKQGMSVVDVSVSEDPIVKMMKRVQETSPLFAVVKIPGRQVGVCVFFLKKKRTMERQRRERGEGKLAALSFLVSKGLKIQIFRCTD